MNRIHRVIHDSQENGLKLVQTVDQHLILLRGANRNPQELRNPLLLEVPNNHTLLAQFGNQLLYLATSKGNKRD